MEGWIEMVARVGLDGIEVYKPLVRPLNHQRVKELVQSIEQAGLEISCSPATPTSRGNDAQGD